MECDEQKPICSRCLKGSRECSYPPKIGEQSHSAKVIEGTKEINEVQWHNSGSESTLNLDIFKVDDSTQKVIMKFSGQGSWATASVDLFQVDGKFLTDFLRAPTDVAEYINCSSNSLMTRSISGVSPSPQPGEVIQSSTDAHTHIPTVPKSSRDQCIQFFLRFHQENIDEFHYFCYHDYRKFYTTTLMVMVQQSNALCNAVVAFSALIYSIKVNHFTRVQAFTYYALALQQLRVLLDQTTMNADECHMATAAALQLACFDVFTIWMMILIHSVS